MVRIIWYFEVYQPNLELDDKNEYIDLTVIAQSYNLIAGFDSLVTLLLFVSLVKYVMFWVAEVALITTTLRVAWKIIRLWICLAFMVILGFVQFHFFVMGVYHINMPQMYYAIPFFMQVFLGKYNAGRESEVFLTPIMMLVSLSFFFLFKQIVWYTQVMNVSTQLGIARTMERKEEADVEKEEQLDDQQKD